MSASATLQALSGAYGFKVVTTEDVSPSKGYFTALVPDGGAATFSAVSDEGDDLTEAERTAGVVGRFSAVSVTDGTVLAYYSVEQ